MRAGGGRKNSKGSISTGKFLQLYGVDFILSSMGVPNEQATLTPEQVADLNRKLSHMRHEINNQLSLVVAAVELVRFRPDLRDRMLNTMAEQPGRITQEVAKFSDEFERAFGITKD